LGIAILGSMNSVLTEIEALRESLELPVDKFAVKLGVSKHTYYRWIREDRAVLSNNVLLKLYDLGLDETNLAEAMRCDASGK